MQLVFAYISLVFIAPVLAADNCTFLKAYKPAMSQYGANIEYNSDGTIKGYNRYIIRKGEWDRDDNGKFIYNINPTLAKPVTVRKKCEKYVTGTHAMVDAKYGSLVLYEESVNSNNVFSVPAEYDVANVYPPLLLLSKTDTADGGCQILYYIPDVFKGVEDGRLDTDASGKTEAHKDSNGRPTTIDKVGVVDTTSNCKSKSCNDVTFEEYRALAELVKNKEAEAQGLGGMDRCCNDGVCDTNCIMTSMKPNAKPDYTQLKYCIPTTDGKAPASNDSNVLYCHQMKDPKVFPFVVAKGLTQGERPDYNCVLHSCDRNKSQSIFLETNFDSFSTNVGTAGCNNLGGCSNSPFKTNSSGKFKDMYGETISYFEAYERDVLHNPTYTKTTTRTISCNPIPLNANHYNDVRIVGSQSLVAKCSKIVNEQQVLDFGTTCKNEFENVCDKYIAIDNDSLTSTNPKMSDLTKKSLLNQWDLFKVKDDFSQLSCTKTKDCGLNKNKNNDDCKTAAADSSDVFDSGYSYYTRPTPAGGSSEVVCTLGDKTYGKYYTNYHEMACLLGKGRCMFEVTNEYKTCVDNGGRIRRVLNRALFGIEDRPYRSDYNEWNYESLIDVTNISLSPGGMAAFLFQKFKAGISLTVAGVTCAVTGAATLGLYPVCCPGDSNWFTGIRHEYDDRRTHNFYKQARDNGSGELFCASNSSFKDYLSWTDQDVLCSADTTSGRQSLTFQEEMNMGVNTKGGAPSVPLNMCDGTNFTFKETGSNTACMRRGGILNELVSTLTFGTMDGANCDQPYWDSFYIKGDPGLVWDPNKPEVTSVKVTVCMRKTSSTELGVCGARESMHTYVLGGYIKSSKGYDKCVDLTVDADNDCTFESLVGTDSSAGCVNNIDSGTAWNDFRVRARRIGKKIYAFVDRTDGGCIGKNTTRGVVSSSEIDDLRDFKTIYGACVSDKVEKDATHPFGFSSIHCRDNLADITGANACADETAGGCYKSTNMDDITFTSEMFIKNPLQGNSDSLPYLALLGANQSCEGTDDDIYEKDTKGSSGQNGRCRVIVFKSGYDRNEDPHTIGRQFVGRLSNVSLFDDNSLNDNDCDGKITDKDVRGEYLFNVWNCAYMYSADLKELPETTGGGTGNYIFVEPSDWCGINTRYTRDKSNTPFKERFGSAGFEGDGEQHGLLVNRNCKDLRIEKPEGNVSSRGIPWKKLGDEASGGFRSSIGVIQYIGNDQPLSSDYINQACTVDKLSNCRGTYSHEYYTASNTTVNPGWQREQQGASIPLAVSPPEWWRYAVPSNAPDLFLPIIQIYQYRKVGTDAYLNFSVGNKTQLTDFFTPSVKVRYGAVVSNAVTIAFSKSFTAGEISTIYNKQTINSNYKFRKYGQVYPKATGFACVQQILNDGTEQQIGCVLRGNPLLQQLALVPPTEGLESNPPFIKSFFHDGDTLRNILNTNEDSRDYFVNTNISFDSLEDSLELIFSKYGKSYSKSNCITPGGSCCGSLPDDKSPDVTLAVEKPKKRCEELQEQLAAIKTDYRKLKDSKFAYASSYPVFFQLQYCTKLHYECVKDIKDLQAEERAVKPNENTLQLLRSKVNLCESQVTSYCRYANGSERVVQLDRDVDIGKVIYMKEDYIIDGVFNEMCATTGFEKYFDKNGSDQAVWVVAYKLPYSTSGHQGGIGKCELEPDETGKLNPACRRDKYYVYCDGTNTNCLPLSDVQLDLTALNSKGDSAPINECSLSKRNCIQEISCACSNTVECLSLPSACFKSGFNLFKTLTKTDGNSLATKYGDTENTDRCACRVVDKSNMSTMAFNNDQEMRIITPRELGLCVPMQTLNFCEPVRYYDEENKSYATDGGAGNPLLKIISLFPNNIWRTYQKIMGLYYIPNDLGHAEFDKSNICRNCSNLSGTALSNCQSWNATFCLSQSYTFNIVSGEKCEDTTNKNCQEHRVVFGECRSFWKEKPDVKPLAICEMVNNVPTYVLKDKTECERYTCPGLNEEEVFKEGYDEMADYSEDSVDTFDKRGMGHGYALWKSYKKGSDLSQCDSEESCEFFDYANATNNKYANTYEGKTIMSTHRSGKENGRGDDVEERIAIQCEQGFGPAGANVILRKFMAYLPGNNINMPLNTVNRSKYEEYITNHLTPYVSSILGYTLGYYDHRDINKEFKPLTEYSDKIKKLYKEYEDFVALTSYAPLTHLPVRYCSQVGEWMSPMDLYNQHSIPGFYKGNQIFENGVLTEFPPEATSKNEGMYMGNYCERLYCPSFDAEYAGYISTEQCTLDGIAGSVNNTLPSANCPEIVSDCTEDDPNSIQANSKCNKVFWNANGKQQSPNVFQYPTGIYTNYAKLDANNLVSIFTLPYSIPKAPTVMDLRINNAIDNRPVSNINNTYTIWRHAGGATWPEVSAPRTQQYKEYILGKCIEERRFFPIDTKFITSFEDQFDKLVSTRLGQTALQTTSDGETITMTERGTLQADGTFSNDVKKLVNGKTLIITPVVTELTDKTSPKTQPTRSCSQWGTWNEITDSCVSVCEALDPFRSDFYDENQNGYLENWEITAMKSKPVFNRGSEYKYDNRLRLEVQPLSGWKGFISSQQYDMNGKETTSSNVNNMSAIEYLKLMWARWSGTGAGSTFACADGIDGCDGNARATVSKVAMPCEGNENGCGSDLFAFNNGYGDYVTKSNVVDGKIIPTWRPISEADMVKLADGRTRTYSGIRLGDRYTGGAKWPRSVSTTNKKDVNLNTTKNQYVNIDGKVYVKGTCFSTVGERYNKRGINTWVEGFPDEGATFVQTGPTSTTTGTVKERLIAQHMAGAPYRECMPDGTWGEVHNPCANFRTCADFKVNTKNYLQDNIDYNAEVMNTPQTFGITSGGAVDYTKAGITTAHVTSVTSPSVTQTKFGFQVVNGKEAFSYIGTLEGGKINMEDVLKAMNGTGTPTVPIVIPCNGVNSPFLVENNTSGRNTIAKVGRFCNLTNGSWEKGYDVSECRMKACGDVSYIIGSGANAIPIVDYKITKTATNADNIILEGGRNVRTAQNTLINNINGIFYPINSGYSGEVRFGKYESSDKQMFTDYRFYAKCPNGYVCKDCGEKKELEFTCDMGNNPSVTAEPFWVRRGECVPQTCVWQYDVSRQQFPNDNDFNAIISSGKVEYIASDRIALPVPPLSSPDAQKIQVVIQGLPWKDKFMIKPNAIFDEYGEQFKWDPNFNAVVTEVARRKGLDVKGGIPPLDLNSYYKPAGKSDTTRPVITQSSFPQTQTVLDITNTVQKVNLNARPLLMTRDSMVNGNDVVDVTSNVPSSYPTAKQPIYKSGIVNDAVYMSNNIRDTNIESPTRLYTSRMYNHTTAHSTTQYIGSAMTLLNSNYNKIIFPTDSDSAPAFYDSYSFTTDTAKDKFATEVGRIVVGTTIRMDAFCSRKAGLFYPKDKKIEAVCKAAYASDNKTLRGETGIWEIKVESGQSNKCIRTCDVRTIPFDYNNKYYGDIVKDNIPTGDGTEYANKYDDMKGVIPSILAWTDSNTYNLLPKSSGSGAPIEIRNRKGALRTLELNSNENAIKKAGYLTELNVVLAKIAEVNTSIANMNTAKYQKDLDDIERYEEGGCVSVEETDANGVISYVQKCIEGMNTKKARGMLLISEYEVADEVITLAKNRISQYRSANEILIGKITNSKDAIANLSTGSLISATNPNSIVNKIVSVIATIDAKVMEQCDARDNYINDVNSAKDAGVDSIEAGNATTNLSGYNNTMATLINYVNSIKKVLGVVDGMAYSSSGGCSPSQLMLNSSTIMSVIGNGSNSGMQKDMLDNIDWNTLVSFVIPDNYQSTNDQIVAVENSYGNYSSATSLLGAYVNNTTDNFGNLVDKFQSLYSTNINTDSSTNALRDAVASVKESMKELLDQQLLTKSAIIDLKDDVNGKLDIDKKIVDDIKLVIQKEEFKRVTLSETNKIDEELIAMQTTLEPIRDTIEEYEKQLAEYQLLLNELYTLEQETRNLYNSIAVTGTSDEASAKEYVKKMNELREYIVRNLVIKKSNGSNATKNTDYYEECQDGKNCSSLTDIMDRYVVAKDGTNDANTGSANYVEANCDGEDFYKGNASNNDTIKYYCVQDGALGSKWVKDSSTCVKYKQGRFNATTKGSYSIKYSEYCEAYPSVSKTVDFGLNHQYDTENGTDFNAQSGGYERDTANGIGCEGGQRIAQACKLTDATNTYNISCINGKHGCGYAILAAGVGCGAVNGWGDIPAFNIDAFKGNKWTGSLYSAACPGNCSNKRGDDGSVSTTTAVYPCDMERIEYDDHIIKHVNPVMGGILFSGKCIDGWCNKGAYVYAKCDNLPILQGTRFVCNADGTWTRDVKCGNSQIPSCNAGFITYSKYHEGKGMCSNCTARCSGNGQVGLGETYTLNCPACCGSCPASSGVSCGGGGSVTKRCYYEGVPLWR